jgi:hypothetical protein
MANGEPMPDLTTAIRRSREGHEQVAKKALDSRRLKGQKHG